MIILKFGGAALSDSTKVKNVVDYIGRVQHKKPVVVVSAMQGTTDMLIDSIKFSLNKNLDEALKNLELIRSKHESVVEDLIKSSIIKKQIQDFLQEKILELQSQYRSISILKDCTNKSHDHIVAAGEKLSSHLVTSVLLDQGMNAFQVDGEELIETDSNFGNAYPQFDKTLKKVREKLEGALDQKRLPIITGFTGADERGDTTTLGRGGSDFTASILAYSLDAKEVWYLKDVDGIMSADPRIVKTAKTIENISYQEVAELSYFGAKILHPIAIHPLKEKQILSYIKNVYNFDQPGTKIDNKPIQNGKTVKAVTYIKDVCLVTVQGGGIIGVPGILGRVFTSLARTNISVLMVSQSSSEQNICFVIQNGDESKACKTLEEELELEILKNMIDRIDTQNKVSIISVVGEGMKHTPGISGRIFSALGKNSINIILIAQGSSELNVSFMVDSDDIKAAINCIHEEFSLGE